MSVTFMDILAFRFFFCFWKAIEIVFFFLIHNFGKFEIDTIGDNNLLKKIWKSGKNIKAKKEQQ